METQKTQNFKSNSEQKEQHWKYHNSELQIIPQTHSNKNSRVLEQKQTLKSNATEDPEINPHSYSHLIIDKKTKDIHWRNSASSTNDARKTGYLHAED
jgi:hypothetical protein